MESNKQRLTCEQVRQWDMVDYLSGAGYEPAKIRNADHWYLSPLREEHTPSFKVNRRLNRWYDHGLGKGGNLVDFCTIYFKCGVGEVLEKLTGGFSFQQPEKRAVCLLAKETKLEVLGSFELTSFPLLRYIRSRKIDEDLAALYCREVRFTFGEKTCYAIGFKNNSGGYELRNPFFKGSSSPKDITAISNGQSTVAVFEGFFDFLSYLTYFRDTGLEASDYVILNSISFFEKARPVMEGYREVMLYLDNDTTGQNCSAAASSASARYIDRSILYEGCKDLNKWLLGQQADSS